jgi:hypothetical protein
MAPSPDYILCDKPSLTPARPAPGSRPCADG